MFEILVCTESACKRQMAEEILFHFQALIQQEGLTGLVQAAASPCLGVCREEGITVQIGSTLYVGVTPENMDYVFEEYVLTLFQPQLERDAG